MKVFLSILFSLIYLMGFSQYSIDEALKNIPAKDEKSIETLVAYINTNASNDMEKARGAYFWIANKVAYDAKRFFKEKRSFYIPSDVFRERLAVCEGYANLFQELCKRLKIESFVVTGYSKGYGYRPRQSFAMADHAWNAFRVDSTWYLVDATWAGGYVQRGIFKRKFIRRFEDKYFALKGSEMVVDHLPEAPMWQLLEHPVPIKIFTAEETKILGYIKNATGEKFTYKDSIGQLLGLKQKLDSELVIGKMALRFNPLNTTPMAYAKIDSVFQTFGLTGYQFNDPKNGPDAQNRAILTTNQALQLFKAAKPEHKIQKKYIEESVTYCHRTLAELYLAKARSGESFIRMLLEPDFDTLLLAMKPTLTSLEKALEANGEIRDSQQRKWILNELCANYLMAYMQYKSHATTEDSKEKKKMIQKELTALVQNAKKNIPAKCDCYKRIREWK